MKAPAQIAALAVFAGAVAFPAIAQDQALIERGSYLVNGPVGCGNCHNTRAEDMSFVDGMELAGGFRIVEEGVFDVYGANITPDLETGIGAWTDEEIIVAIREGKSRDGRIIFPPMAVPSYNAMSDDDVRAIVAYLRSVPAVHNPVPESTYQIPLQAMPPAAGLPAPPVSDQVAYGDYIVNALAHCFECHTPMGPGGMPDFANALGAGGFEFQLGPGLHVVSANITPDPATGIGDWSDEEIKRAITDGIGREGGHLAPPMPYSFFANTTEEDLDAIVAYLRTIPPIRNEVVRTEFQQQAFP